MNYNTVVFMSCGLCVSDRYVVCIFYVPRMYIHMEACPAGPHVKVCVGANSITLKLKQFPVEFNSCPLLQVSSPRTSVSSQRNKAPINSSL